MAKLKYPLAGVCLLTVFLFIYFGKFYFNANHLSFAPWGDGYKNYYTFAWYLKHDAGAHFTGMNYPYGENVIYTDNQPLVAWLLKPAYALFPALNSYTHAIVVWLIFFSHLLCFYFLYRILNELKVSPAIAALFAVFITLLSPQLIRLNGHFSLAYTCIIPLVLLLLLRFLNSGYKLKYILWLSLVISAATFIHPYYMPITGMLLAGVALICFVIEEGWREKTTAFALTLTPVIIAFLVFKLYLVVTDASTDRPTAPYGFLESAAQLKEILFHPNCWTTQIFDKLVPGDGHGFDMEHAAFIGTLGPIALFFIIVGWLVRLARRRLQFATLSKEWAIILIASFPILLFALAFPFSLSPKFAAWLDVVPSTIKQFRSAGRFAWMFYYTVAISTAVIAYQAYATFNKKIAAYSVLAAIGFVWFLDINTVNILNVKILSRWAVKTDENTDIGPIKTLLASSGRNISGFQAIVPLPFYETGSEKIYLESGSNFQTMKTALFTGLPLAGGQMSRTSQAISFRIVNLLSGPLIKKDILKDYNSKPLLLISTVETKHYSRAEKDLLSKGRYLFRLDDADYYELPLSAFKDSIAIVKNNTRLSDFVDHGDYLTNSQSPDVLIKTFDNKPSDFILGGNGAFYNKIGNEWLMGGDILPWAEDSTYYEVSAWFYTDSKKPVFPYITITQADTAGKEVAKFNLVPSHSTETYGNWVRASAVMLLQHRKNKIYAGLSLGFTGLDELMFRPVNRTVITHVTSADNFWLNNYPLY